jgi:hypothetical protein
VVLSRSPFAFSAAVGVVFRFAPASPSEKDNDLISTSARAASERGCPLSLDTVFQQGQVAGGCEPINTAETEFLACVVEYQISGVGIGVIEPYGSSE